MSTNVNVTAATAIAQLYAQKKQPAPSVNTIIDIVLRTQAGMAAQVQYLNGTSPNNNASADRCDFAKVLIAEAGKAKMELPAAMKPMDIAKVAFKRMKAAGLPMARNGKIALQYTAE